MGRSVRAALFVAVVIGGMSRIGLASDSTYRFKVDDPVCYEVKITQDIPGGGSSTTVNYLKYRPSAVTPEGQITLRHDWWTSKTTVSKDGASRNTGGPPAAFLFGPQPADDSPASETTIDPRGAVIRVSNPSDNVQLDNLLGPVYGVMLIPTPPDGQTTWTTQRQVTAYSETTDRQPDGPWGWGRRDVKTRVERECKENITFTAEPVANGLQTIHRNYELASESKINGTPVDRLTGTGDFVFDTVKGTPKSYEAKMTYSFTQANLNITIPVVVSAHRIDEEEMAKLKAEHEKWKAGQAKLIAEREKKDAARQKAEALGVKEVRELPPGMSMTKTTPAKGGGPFIRVNVKGRAVIGFAVQHGTWGGQKVIREVQPLYEAPDNADKKDTDRQFIVAKDGYALGGLWVNADDTNVIAMRLIFMKKTDKGLDTKQAYVSPWVGTLSGSSRVRFGGTGKIVTGIFGRQGLNTAAIGLVMLDDDPTDDPNFKDAPAVKDPTDDPNFKG